MGTDNPDPFAKRSRRTVGRFVRKVKRTLPQGQDRSPATVPSRKRESTPRDLVRLGVDWARLPMAEGNWPEAIQRWERVLDQFGPTSSWSAYRGLIVSYTNAGDLGAAEAVAARSREVFPESVELADAWAELPMAEEDWNGSIDRWNHVIDRFGPTASWRPYTGLANCYEQLGDIDAAVAAAEQGRNLFPDTIDAVSTWAQMAMVEGNWEEAVERWNEVLDRFETVALWKVYLRLAISHGRLGDTAAAEEALERGLARYPQSLTLIAHAAELAMARRDWPLAVRRWNGVLNARAVYSPGPLVRSSFPRRGSQWDWHEDGWQAIAREWDDIVLQLGFQPSPLLYRALAMTMEKAVVPESALDMLRFGVAAHPNDQTLAFDLAVADLEYHHNGDRSSVLRSLAVELEQHPMLARFCEEAAGPSGEPAWLANLAERDGLGPVAAVCASNLETMASFAPAEMSNTDGLGSIHLIRAAYGSSVELQMKAGRYFSRAVLGRRTREISERDAWEEMTAPENLMFKRARALADAFGERFEDLPLLTADGLSDSVLFFIFHELTLYEPMRRLAADIAAEADPSPVFIESISDSFAYLDGYSFSQFDVLYLYFELRRLGVNAFLCRYHGGKPPAEPTIEFPAGVRSLLPRGDVQDTAQVEHHQALIPAGVRSVRRVVDALDSPLVYSSGSVVKEFAYDRSIQQAFPIEPGATLHPSEAVLPTFTFSMWPAAVLQDVPLSPKDGLDVQSRIEISQDIGGDWFLWLNRVLHDYLAGISSNAYAEIAARGVKEAHISDHIFADSALFAGAVKQTGGRVVLWPHSANPVHVQERKAGSFDEVHAVTLAGAERWRSRFPEVTVVHSPSTMLDPPTRNAPVDDDQPLSLIVVGGRSVLRHMPILDQSKHEASHRAFFAGLEQLQQRFPLDVYFKPRGHTGEQEMWLDATVGSTANWRRVLEHPMRMDLPNMLLVSISMGSSALLEGLSRGIPGLVVRDFPVRDYTTLDEDAIPTGKTEAMLEVVASCFEPDGYERLLESELAYYVAELGDGDQP